MSVLLLVLVVVAAYLVERWRYGGRWANREDVVWFVTHFFLLPSAFAGVVLRAGGLSLPRALAWLVLFDLAFYVIHRALHSSSWGWAMHRLHHEQRELGTLATWRLTVAERVFFGLAGVGVAALVGASAWDVICGSTVSVAVQVAAHWPRACGHLGERLGVVSSRTHHVHHWCGSRWNYGHALTWWDRLFGTYREPGPYERRAMGDADELGELVPARVPLRRWPWEPRSRAVRWRQVAAAEEPRDLSPEELLEAEAVPWY